MIEVYKIVRGRYDALTALRIIRTYSTVTRGNNIKLP